MSEDSTTAKAPTAREINETIRYAMWSVFAVSGPLAEDRAAAGRAGAADLDALSAKGLTVRGWYDVAGLRADADLMVWWHAPDLETVQQAYRTLRRTALGRSLRPVWSVAAVHRPAEFNKGHVPAFMAGEEPRGFICVYPFVRSLRVVPAAGRRAPPDAGRARHGGPRPTATCGPTRSRRSPWATTSGSWPSRPTRCTGSST